MLCGGGGIIQFKGVKGLVTVVLRKIFKIIA